MSVRADALLATLADLVAERLADRLAELLRESRPESAKEQRYLGERTVAERLSISVRTLQGWRSVGRGPEFQKAGRRVLYPADGLHRFLGRGDASKKLPEAAATATASPSRKRRVVRAATQ